MAQNYQIITSFADIGVNEMKKDYMKSLEELRKIYPEVVAIVDNWMMFAHIHGEKQSPQEKKILKKYVKILTDLGVLPIK